MNGLPFGAAIAASPLGVIAALAMGVAVIGVAPSALGSGFGLHRVDLRVAQAKPEMAPPATTGSASELQGIGLTASHRRIIFENVAGERVQKLADDQKPSVGGIIPDSIMLNEIPIAVKDQVGLLRDFKIARLPDDNILIVDPASRKIVDIITREASGVR
jgi:hypothetical protein